MNRKVALHPTAGLTTMRRVLATLSVCFPLLSWGGNAQAIIMDANNYIVAPYDFVAPEMFDFVSWSMLGDHWNGVGGFTFSLYDSGGNLIGSKTVDLTQVTNLNPTSFGLADSFSPPSFSDPVGSVHLTSFQGGSFNDTFLEIFFQFPLMSGGSATVGEDLTSSMSSVAVPGPIVGAGLPGLIFAGGGLLALAQRRRRQLVA